MQAALVPRLLDTSQMGLDCIRTFHGYTVEEGDEVGAGFRGELVGVQRVDGLHIEHQERILASLAEPLV